MPKNIKAVVDSNVIISAIIGISFTSRQIFTAFVEGMFTPVVSDDLIKELRDVVKKPRLKKYFSPINVKRFQTLIHADAINVTPAQTIDVCRDPKDNFILAIALEARADFIVSGDGDLLALNPFKGVSILPPREFLDILKK